MSGLPAHVCAFFEEVEGRRGAVRADEVHDEVAQLEHPLHGRYEWDDSVAGRKYRLQQINDDIRSYMTVTVSPRTGEPVTIRKFVALKECGRPGTGYISTEVALRDPESRAYMLTEFKRQAEQLRGKYQHMVEFAAVISETFADVLPGNSK